MKKLTPILFCWALGATGTWAQTDITKFYLSNYGFDSSFDYPATSKATVEKEIKAIDGWTPDLSADYTITGIYEFGFGGTFNGGTVPAKGYNGETGGALALSTGWEQTFCYYQTITLPAGTYTVKVPTYNAKTATAGSSKLAWIPSEGTTVSSTRSSYPGKQWTLDQITFTLKKQTTGKLQIGYKAGPNGSANSANLLIDYVQLSGQNMTVNKKELQAAIVEGTLCYADGTGKGAADLKTALDQAKAVNTNSKATMPEVLEATWNLKQAISDYRMANVSEDNPVDYTSHILNPSFETGNTDNWTVSGMATQNNSTFSSKKGTYYLEAWVNRGQQIGKASASQVLKDLPDGNYKLSAYALHVQQSSTSGTSNTGAEQTGAWLYAGSQRTPVTAMKRYDVKFAVIDGESDVEIGLLAEGATGNYLCVDNFTLAYTGALTADSYVQDLSALIDRADEYANKGIQNSVRQQLSDAITNARKTLESSSDNQEAINQARKALKTAIQEAKASIARYAALQTRVDYANKVLEWWKDDKRKATAVASLQTAVGTANSQLTDYTLTDTQITQAVTTLNTKITAVDKKIYCSGSACGSDTQLKDPSNQWCYDRSIQSKHWILFWEDGYGKDAPASAESILNTADKIFELYADSLKFITIGQGKSKTDTYKMIIRLRYTTEWEASGSGIDNTIGMLTLSRWAYTSRSGQTVAHEIGHCFQYQTHCDNGDQNGWMYTWANSQNGNVFWEMCAQWQAYKFYPDMQFNNEWLNNTLNGFHKNPLAEELRYNNYFIQDYFCHKHGMDIIARLWNESKNPEDPFQAYMRLTMPSTMTATQKLEQFNNEMWEYGARMTTFDLDPIRSRGEGTIGKRAQTKLTQEADGFWASQSADCIENFGNNAIRVNAPVTDKKIYAQFVGEAGKDGFIKYNTNKAGWKYGFVALMADGTRRYGDIATANYAKPEGVVEFDCPAGCRYVWLVVSGAPTSYWSRGWNGTTTDDEQWPYKVKFYQTNVYGNTNNEGTPSSIGIINRTDAPTNDNVYSVSGQVVRRGTTSLQGLPKGIYIVGGRKVVKN